MQLLRVYVNNAQIDARSSKLNAEDTNRIVQND